MATYIPDRRKLIALEREQRARADLPSMLPPVAWLDREVVSESRAVAACILRAAACPGLEVAPEDLNWAGRWVASDEGWDPAWGRLPEEARP